MKISQTAFARTCQMISKIRRECKKPHSADALSKIYKKICKLEKFLHSNVQLTDAEIDEWVDLWDSMGELPPPSSFPPRLQSMRK